MPREDATVVTRLLDAGAHIVGKTAVPAFCFDGGGLTGYPDPQPVNPHDAGLPRRSSSNGSAVVLVTGEADLALGGDQGGSIRLPASWSGCCGHKPTFGLVPYTGDLPDRADDRPHRPDGAHRGRLRADAGRDRRRGRARPAPDRRRRCRTTPRRSTSAPTACASACWPRASGSRTPRRPTSTPPCAPPPTSWPAPARASRRSRSRCTATGSRSGTRSRSRARPT